MYDIASNEYYEVKHYVVGQSWEGSDQQLKYETGIIAARKLKFLGILDPPTAGTNSKIGGKFPYGDYEVIYWYDKNGLILYSFKPTKEAIAKTVAAFAGVCASMVPDRVGAGFGGGPMRNPVTAFGLS